SSRAPCSTSSSRSRCRPPWSTACARSSRAAGKSSASRRARWWRTPRSRSRSCASSLTGSWRCRRRSSTDIDALAHPPSFLLGSLGLAALARPAHALARNAFVRGAAPARTLVLIQLTGGNDGLSTLVPYEHDVYARARSSTRIAAKDVLRIDSRVGLHPSLG